MKSFYYLNVFCVDTLFVEFFGFSSYCLIEIVICSFDNVYIVIEKLVTSHFHFFRIDEFSLSVCSLRYPKDSLRFWILVQHAKERTVLAIIYLLVENSFSVLFIS